MKRIVLYGEIGRKFGKHWKLDVQSPAEALCAIRANTSGFSEYLYECFQRGQRFRVFVGHTELPNIEQVGFPTSDMEVIRIVPIMAGAGSGPYSGIITTIVGIALLFFPPTFGMGVALIISGVVQMITFTPPRQKDPNQAVDNKPSFFFNGAVNTTLQGGCVPACYGGPIEVGSQVISVGMFTEDI